MKQEKKTFGKIISYTIKILSFLPAVFLLFLIFGFSAQDGESSGSLSFQVSLFLVRLFSPLIPTVQSEDVLIEYAEVIHLYVRKAAHMTEYFLLALSLQLPLAAWCSKLLYWKKRILIGAAATVFLAALDEFHQSFVPGRSGNFIDVCIDSVGVLAASLCLYIFFLIREKRLAR
ncbi:MAG: VanZ family protein [Lachnospiraceae bacterium]|nr:VanZ family protein [Lachnospiraceae bacterium]